MNVRWFVGVAVVATLAATPVAAQERLVHQEIDRQANAVVRVFKTTDGGRVEVAAGQLKISKSIAGTKAVTRMTGGGQELVIAMDDSQITVSNGIVRASASRTDRARLERVRALVAESQVGRQAAALIGNLGFGSGTPVQPLLLTTRKLILAATGNTAGLRETTRWEREAREMNSPTPRLMRVSWSEPSQEPGKGMTPTDCWEAYSKEAVLAYVEYEECMKDVKWYDVLGNAACATVYDMRAIGAFSWWLKCVALN